MAIPKSPQQLASSQVQQAERLAARLAALEQARARYAALRKVHRHIAQDFAQLRSDEARKLVKRALENVHVWESGGIASPYYVRAWRRILQDPAQLIPKMLRGHNANALVQNSPFGFIYREPRYRKELSSAHPQKAPDAS